MKRYLIYLGEENIVTIYGDVRTSLYFIELNKKIDRSPEDLIDDPMCECDIATIDDHDGLMSTVSKDRYIKVEVEHV